MWHDRQADHVLEVARGIERAALHVEVAAEPEPDVPTRVLVYNAGLRLSGYRQVCSVVIYLKPGSRKRAVKDEVQDDGAGVSPLAFSFQAIRLWEEDARALLAGDTGLLPFLPYARGSTPEMVHHGLRRLSRRVRHAGRRADQMAILATFATDRFREVDWFAMIPREIQMQSKFLQELERRGEKRGEERGEKRGRLEVLRHQLECRLGSAARRFTGSLETATPSQLERLAKLLVSGLPDEELVEGLSKLFQRRWSRARTSTTTPRGTRRKSGR